MAAAKTETPKPSIGRIVIYRTRDGIDLPAIITALVDTDGRAVHIEQFAPPGVAKDHIGYQWGVEGPSLESGCWRWPERT